MFLRCGLARARRFHPRAKPLAGSIQKELSECGRDHRRIAGLNLHGNRWGLLHASTSCTRGTGSTRPHCLLQLTRSCRAKDALIFTLAPGIRRPGRATRDGGVRKSRLLWGEVFMGTHEKLSGPSAPETQRVTDQVSRAARFGHSSPQQAQPLLPCRGPSTGPARESCEPQDARSGVLHRIFNGAVLEPTAHRQSKTSTSACHTDVVITGRRVSRFPIESSIFFVATQPPSFELQREGPH